MFRSVHRRVGCTFPHSLCLCASGSVSTKMRRNAIRKNMKPKVLTADVTDTLANTMQMNVDSASRMREKLKKNKS